MKLLTRLTLILALNGALPGCGLVISGRPPPDAEPIIGADATQPDAGSDPARDSGLDGGSSLGCVDVEAIHTGYALDCALECPWSDPSCSLRERNDCLSELQTAAGLHDCARWEAALAAPLCTNACSSSPDGGLDGGTIDSDAGSAVDGGPTLIASGDACNTIIELWTVYELTSLCLADGPGGTRPGRCPGWSARYCDRDLVNACTSALAAAAFTPDCALIFETWTTPMCATACRDELTP